MRPARDISNRIKLAYPDAVVIGRGRNFIKHQYGSRVILDVSQSSLHYGSSNEEVDTAWVADASPWSYRIAGAGYTSRVKALFNGAPLVQWERSGQWVTLQPRQLNLTNDRGDIQQISSVQAVAGQITDDLCRWVGAYGPGYDFEFQNHPDLLIKRLILQDPGVLPTPTAQILGGGNPVLQVQFVWSWSSGVTVFVNGSEWDRRSSVDTTGPIVFMAGSEEVGCFVPAKVFGSDGGEPGQIVQRVSKSGPNFLVEVRVSYSWLAEAEYPVVIDPTISSLGITNTLDDGYEFSVTSGRVEADPSNMDLNTDRKGFMRWPLDIPQGSTINSAYFSVFVYSAADNTPKHNIHCEAVDNAAALVNDSNWQITNKSLTAASVAWNTTLTKDAWNSSPDLSAPLQEVIDRPGWQANNYAGFLIIPMPGVTEAVQWRDYTTGPASTITVEYTEGATTTDLAIEGTGHSHTSETLALTQEQNLSISSSGHSHTVDELTVAQTHQLSISDASHIHVADEVAIEQGGGLVIESATHVHTADVVQLYKDGVILDCIIADLNICRSFDMNVYLGRSAEHEQYITRRQEVEAHITQTQEQTAFIMPLMQADLNIEQDIWIEVEG